MAQSTVGTYSNPLKKFKYVIISQHNPVDHSTLTIAFFRLVFLGEQSGESEDITFIISTTGLQAD